jgi:hypothetical protein
VKAFFLRLLVTAWRMALFPAMIAGEPLTWSNWVRWMNPWNPWMTRPFQGWRGEIHDVPLPRLFFAFAMLVVVCAFLAGALVLIASEIASGQAMR